ncbi:MAG: hypothetical protein PVI43_00175 [Candidatus Bathyarchaeota archaeon]|jgi:hypothetical protein
MLDDIIEAVESFEKLNQSELSQRNVSGLFKIKAELELLKSAFPEKKKSAKKTLKVGVEEGEGGD